MQLDYDVVVVASGDGLVHEVFNAFADRDDSADAFALPVVQLPMGSANGFSIALLGVKVSKDTTCHCDGSSRALRKALTSVRLR